MALCVSSHLPLTYPFFLSHRGSIRRKSMHIGRGLAGSVGGFLPGAVTGLWDPQRDFAFLKLPTAGVKSVVALSRWVPLLSSRSHSFTESTADFLLLSSPTPIFSLAPTPLQQHHSTSHGHYLRRPLLLVRHRSGERRRVCLAKELLALGRRVERVSTRASMGGRRNR